MLDGSGGKGATHIITLEKRHVQFLLEVAANGAFPTSCGTGDDPDMLDIPDLVHVGPGCGGVGGVVEGNGFDGGV